jgi:hypothetical protein
MCAARLQAAYRFDFFEIPPVSGPFPREKPREVSEVSEVFELSAPEG